MKRIVPLLLLIPLFAFGESVHDWEILLRADYLKQDNDQKQSGIPDHQNFQISFAYLDLKGTINQKYFYRIKTRFHSNYVQSRANLTSNNLDYFSVDYIFSERF